MLVDIPDWALVPGTIIWITAMAWGLWTDWGRGD